MLTLGTYWTTRYSMVSEHTCTINHKMDRNMWQTIISFDLVHSSNMWLQTILSCGKHCKTMQIGTVSRLRFCRRSWGFKIYIRWTLVHFRKPYVCSNQLDVEWMVYPHLIYGIWSSQFLTETRIRMIKYWKPLLDASSSNYSEWNIDNKWSSQVWKSREMSNTSTGRPEFDKIVIDDDMDSDTATESNLSLRSRSFLNRVNDRLRKMLDRSPEDSMQDMVKRSMIWRMLMSSTVEASVLIGKNYSDNLHSIRNTRKYLILKQMFEISEKLILEQSDEIFGVSQISWENSSWKQLSLVNDEEVISLSHAKVTVFSDSVLCLGKMNQNPTSNTVWEQQLDWFKDSSQYRALDIIDGESIEFEWNIFPGFSTLELVQEVQKFMNKMGDPEQSQGLIFMSMFNDIIWWIKDNEKGMYC